MNRFAKSGLAALCSGLTLAALTARSVVAANGPATPQQQAEQAVKLRQALFDVQSFAFSPVGAMMKGAPFNAQAAVTAGQRIEMTSSMIPEVFRADTSKFTLNTRALTGIWSNMADFQHKAANLNAAAVNLAAAAKTGDKDATLTAAKAVGKACAACHDEYKET